MRNFKLVINRQSLLFLFSGAMQYCLDILLFSFGVFLGFSIERANISSRVVAGCIGFLFNGVYVFKTISLASDDFALYFISFLKYVLLLAATTLISTLMIKLLCLHVSADVIIFKIIVEILLAILSFLIQKFIVFRSKS